MPDKRRWWPGDVVVVRDVGSANALLWGRPYVVVEDSEDLIALFQPEGAHILRWHLEEQRFVEPHIAWMECLRILLPGKPYDVTLVFETGTGVPPYWAAYFSGEGRFRGWKVNLQTPIRRTRLGFDTTDEVLDIIVRPDRSWYWKDEEQLRTWRAGPPLRRVEEEASVPACAGSWLAARGVVGSTSRAPSGTYAVRDSPSVQDVRHSGSPLGRRRRPSGFSLRCRPDRLRVLP